jgi:hypothetical protein
VGDRPRGWVWQDLLDAYNDRKPWAGPGAANGLHLDGADGGLTACALVLRALPSSELDTLHGRVGESEAEVERLKREAHEAAEREWKLQCRVGAQDLDIEQFRADAVKLLASRNLVQDERDAALKRCDEEQRECLAAVALAEARSAGLVVAHAELGESQSQLASAHLACEAGRKARDEAVEELEAVKAQHAHAVGVVDERDGELYRMTARPEIGPTWTHRKTGRPVIVETHGAHYQLRYRYQDGSRKTEWLNVTTFHERFERKAKPAKRRKGGG